MYRRNPGRAAPFVGYTVGDAPLFARASRICESPGPTSRPRCVQARQGTNNAPRPPELPSMPAVSYDSLSFLLDGARTKATRLSISGAAFDATLIDPVRWATELARLRHAGFNTVVIRVPWALHEPTPDRFVFEGACDVRSAIRLAGAEGLRVILRIGPCVGGSFARGGLPGWLRDRVGPGVREASPEFLARVTKFWRAVAPQFVDLQASRTGGGEPRPVIAVGVEDDWRCLDGDVGEAYFGALVRYAREIGIDVPLVTANNGWYTHEGAIDAWRGAVDVARIGARTPSAAHVGTAGTSLRR